MNAYTPQFPVDELADLVAGDPQPEIQVVLSQRRSATDWAFQRLPLVKKLAGAFYKRAEAATADMAGRTEQPYDPEREPGNHAFFYIKNFGGLGGNFFDNISPVIDLKDFDDPKRLGAQRGFVIVVQLPGDTIAYLGSHMKPASVLKRSSRELRTVLTPSGLDELDQTVVSFKRDVDWIVWGDHIAVLNASGFHAMFRDIPALRRAVDANLKQITDQIGIVGSDEFAERIKQTPNMTVKLAGIVKRADMHTQKPAALRKYAKEYKIDVGWSAGKMVFDPSPATQWNILRLLDEARTLGPVTGKIWDSASKTEG